VFPNGRQLPSLHKLQIEQCDRQATPAPAGSGIVSCCPGLRNLKFWGLQCIAELLAPLQRLNGLHTLHVRVRDVPGAQATSGKGLEALGHLTQLRALELIAWQSATGLLLQLTQLQRLTRLSYAGPRTGGGISLTYHVG
jgi:hypothetical protein